MPLLGCLFNGEIMDIVEFCESFYLDYVNNYLTMDAIASAYHIPAVLASHILEYGRTIHYNKHSQ